MTGFAKDCLHVICVAAATLLGANLLAAVPAFADELFLSIEGSAGESHDSTHAGWIPLIRIQWGGSSTETASSGAVSGDAAGRYHSLLATKLTDKSSPVLFATMTGGKQFHAATIDELNSAYHLVLKISMQDVIISSLRRGTSNSRPTETLTLHFAKVAATGSTATVRTGTLSQPIQ